MSKKTIFQDSFLISGIMCHEGCGSMVKSNLNTQLENLKKANQLPQNTQLIIDAEPQALGIHRLTLTAEVDDGHSEAVHINKSAVPSLFRFSIEDCGFEIITDDKQLSIKPSGIKNWINISLNILALGAIIALHLIFSPSLMLSISMALICFITTAFTARDFFLNLIKTLRHKSPSMMDMSITLGWCLFLAHGIYHIVQIPAFTGLSMIFMTFAMPVMLIGIVNFMDEIRRLIVNQTRELYIDRIKSLFPEISESYEHHSLTEQEQQQLNDTNNDLNQLVTLAQQLLTSRNTQKQNKKTVTQGMLLTIKRGECLPVDGIVVRGSTLIDSAILTGESNRQVDCQDTIPAGAINLGQDVVIYTTQDSYNSTINKLLFKANRAPETRPQNTGNIKFIYLYLGLVLLAMICAVTIPFGLGIVTPTLIMQNVIGILFTVCPCTLAIAHELPRLLSLHRRNQQGILLREDRLADHLNPVHTIVFDKTGTLTTGESDVAAHEGISPKLWQRLYLLEKHHGADHPLAKAVIKHFETQNRNPLPEVTVRDPSVDSKHRGLSARIQGKDIHMGNADYLKDSGIILPSPLSESIRQKLSQGLTPIFVAQEKVFKGIILVKHQVRLDMIEQLNQLKQMGKQIILLTGDNKNTAHGFNQQNGNIFESEDIYAEQTSTDKEERLKELLSKENSDPKGIWFIGDGLNDAPCARVVSEGGGISCSMTSSDRSAFFTDIALNGSLDYLFKHHQINQIHHRILWQNQSLLLLGGLSFLASIIVASILHIAVPALIPMAIMSATTLLILGNGYRMVIAVDSTLEKSPSWYKPLLSADLSIGLLSPLAILMLKKTEAKTEALHSETAPHKDSKAFTPSPLQSIQTGLTETSNSILPNETPTESVQQLN